MCPHNAAGPELHQGGRLRTAALTRLPPPYSTPKPPKKPQKLDKTSPKSVLVKLVQVLDIESETMVKTFSELVEVRGVEPLTS